MYARRQTRRFPAVLVGVLTTFAVGCGSPAAPTPVMEIENFTGTLAVLGKDFKPFTVTYSATASDASITVTAITAVDDQAAVATTIGVGFGEPAADGSCTRSATHSTNTAQIGQELIATAAFGPGPYCVQIFDAGTLTESVNYAMTVRHF